MVSTRPSPPHVRRPLLYLRFRNGASILLTLPSWYLAVHKLGKIFYDAVIIHFCEINLRQFGKRHLRVIFITQHLTESNLITIFFPNF